MRGVCRTVGLPVLPGRRACRRGSSLLRMGAVGGVTSAVPVIRPRGIDEGIYEGIDLRRQAVAGAARAAVFLAGVCTSTAQPVQASEYCPVRLPLAPGQAGAPPVPPPPLADRCGKRRIRLRPLPTCANVAGPMTLRDEAPRRDPATRRLGSSPATRPGSVPAPCAATPHAGEGVPHLALPSACDDPTALCWSGAGDRVQGIERLGRRPRWRALRRSDGRNPAGIGARIDPRGRVAQRGRGRWLTDARGEALTDA